MKNLFSLFGSFLIVVSMSFMACEKTPTNEVQAPTTDTSVGTYAKNSSNPYDNAGAEHNTYLDQTLKENFKDLSLTRDQAFQKAFEAYAQTNPPSYITYDSIYVRNKTLFDGLRTTTDPTTYLTNNGLGSVAARYVASMLDSLSPSSSTTPRTSQTVCASIKILETDILSNSTVPDQDKAIILSAASVLRHSYCYWEANGPKWALSFQEAGQTGTATASWWDVAKEDGKGAVSGGIGGAAAGAAAGGAGAVPGAAVGAAAGAVGASLASAIFD